MHAITIVARLAAALIGIAALVLAVNSMLKVGFDLISIAIQAVLITFAFFCLWYAALAHVQSELDKLKRTLLIAFVTGAICFAPGFVGPLIFTPQANLGPLLGIFFTGPAGFVVGSVGGFVWTRLRT
jgi:hypothetical protein